MNTFVRTASKAALSAVNKYEAIMERNNAAATVPAIAPQINAKRPLSTIRFIEYNHNFFAIKIVRSDQFIKCFGLVIVQDS